MRNQELESLARVIVDNVSLNNAGGTEQAQVYALAEETGEFVGAMRRWRGMARRNGTEEEAQLELADVVISAYVMADILGWDLAELISIKADKVLNRGWKEPSAN
jgi:NTP pyrophosphatase (non-canonical NTP hydrolase)